MDDAAHQEIELLIKKIEKEELDLILGVNDNKENECDNVTVEKQSNKEFFLIEYEKYNILKIQRAIVEEQMKFQITNQDLSILFNILESNKQKYNNLLYYSFVFRYKNSVSFRLSYLSMSLYSNNNCDIFIIKIIIIKITNIKSSSSFSIFSISV